MAYMDNSASFISSRLIVFNNKYCWKFYFKIKMIHYNNKKYKNKINQIILNNI